jgi:hypothetical protein
MGCLLFLGLDWESFESADSLYLVAQLIGYLALASVALVSLNGIMAKIHGHTRRKRGELAEMGRAPFIFKIIMIPYFLASVVLIGALAAYGYLLSFFGLFMPKFPLILGALMGGSVSVFLLILLVVCYLQIVATSVYSTSDILLTCRRLNVHHGLRALYIVLQFIPLADVISLPIITRYLSEKSEKTQSERERNEYT